ncbi:MAG: hypothetical protein BWY36_00849 [Candidatus Diapherotrites archaeon ADurb.Bin253]|nr:MAG: hypothetical protein BWY36_00849 [Candidatus Diapherotrites archaeon ADurb.Bin253]
MSSTSSSPITSNSSCVSIVSEIAGVVSTVSMFSNSSALCEDSSSKGSTESLKVAPLSAITTRVGKILSKVVFMDKLFLRVSNSSSCSSEFSKDSFTF